MPDMLQDGMSWLQRELTQFASATVTYARGSQLATVQATLGNTLLKLDDGAGGVRLEWTDKDFLIAAADLGGAGIAGDPERGDTITVIVGGVIYTYEVIPYLSEPPWRWSDPYRTTYRIHAKLVNQV